MPILPFLYDGSPDYRSSRNAIILRSDIPIREMSFRSINILHMILIYYLIDINSIIWTGSLFALIHHKCLDHNIYRYFFQFSIIYFLIVSGAISQGIDACNSSFINNQILGDSTSSPTDHLFMRIESDRDEYDNGDSVNYTIIYSNNNSTYSAEDVTITSTFSNLKYNSSNPRPIYSNESTLIWKLGTLHPNDSRIIKLTLDAPDIRDTQYKATQRISGKGFVNVYRKVSDGNLDNQINLINSIKISGIYLGNIYIYSIQSSTNPLSKGYAAKIHEHGSGTYSERDRIRTTSKSGTISIDTELSAKHEPVKIPLESKRETKFDSRFSENFNVENRNILFSLKENYMYLDEIDRYGATLIKNFGVDMDSDTTFNGKGSVVTSESANQILDKTGGVVMTDEAYHGSFRVINNIAALNGAVSKERYAEGKGLVAVNDNLGRNAKTYESGSGYYKIDDSLSSWDSHISQNMNLSHFPIRINYSTNFNQNISQEWSEGISLDSCRKPKIKMEEIFSEINYLNKSIETRYANRLLTSANFSGAAQFKTSLEDSDIMISENDGYVGKYNLSRNIRYKSGKTISSHLKIMQVANFYSNGASYINYDITIINDGRNDLSKATLIDILPPDTRYIESSYETKEIGAGFLRWALYDLKAGDSFTISLKLEVTGQTNKIINQVNAFISYLDEDSYGSASESISFSIINLTWPKNSKIPKKVVTYTSNIDPYDPSLVRYRIGIDNDRTEDMEVSISIQLAEGLKFLNSTISPTTSDINRVVWRGIKVRPNETKNLDYLAKASHNGTFVSKASSKMILGNLSDLWKEEVLEMVQIGSNEAENLLENNTTKVISSSNDAMPLCFCEPSPYIDDDLYMYDDEYNESGYFYYDEPGYECP